MSLLSKFLEIRRISEAVSTFAIDDFDITLRWKSTVHLEKLSGLLTHISISGVYDEINPEATKAEPWNTAIWEWWDENAKFISNPSVYGDLDLILFNTNYQSNVEYGSISSYGNLSNCYLLAIVSNSTVLGWDQTKFLSLLLNIPTVPTLEGLNPKNYSKTSYLETLTHYLKSPSVLGSIDRTSFKPANKVGLYVRTSESFSLSLMGEKLMCVTD